MGIFSWYSGRKAEENTDESRIPKAGTKPEALEIPGLNGAMEVRRPEIPAVEVSVFEFGSVAASGDQVTLAGYCPVSEEIEPCRWEILPAKDPKSPSSG